MQVIEIKNDLVQVRYNAEEQALSLGDFFVISDNNADILAQIVHLETDEETALCLAKFILNINSDNSTSLYNGYMPSLDSVVSPVSKQEIIDFISPVSKGIKLGTLINSNLPVMVSESILDTPLYIQSDYSPACAKLLKLIFSENNTDNNILFYDIDGTFNDFEVTKFELGMNIKVPLNKSFIDFIYENDLNELSVSEKALVQDILLEIKDYIDTTNKDFIEFSTLLNVVNTQYEEQPSDALILFRNKLIEYKQLGYFADSQEEIDEFYSAINSEKAVFSAYKLAKNWQFALCKFCAQSISKRTHLIVPISDTSIDELTINSILTSKFIIPVFVSSYSSKYRNYLRSKIPNMIFFQSVDELSDFPLYVNYLNLLFDNTYIIWGEITSFLSIIASYDTPQQISAKNIVQETKPQEILPEVSEHNKPALPEEITNETEPDSEEESFAEIISDTNTEPVVAEEGELPAEIIQEETETLTTEESESADEEDDFIAPEEDTFSLDDLTEEISSDDTDLTEEIKPEEKPSENLPAEPETNEIPEIIEDTNEEPIQFQEDIADDDLDFLQNEDLNDIEEDNDGFAQEEPSDEIMQPFEDVTQNETSQETDEVYNEPENTENTDTTEVQNEEFSENEDVSDEIIQEEAPLYEEEGIQTVEEEQYEEIEEPQFSIPVYESEPQNTRPENELSPSFVEGNLVYHEKYGKGIIEKVISYGAKTLCSIQFDNIGRRLLDPNLADLKQI